jgi:hypothetical protein
MQTYSAVTGGAPTPTRAQPTPHTTSTYLSPPWTWSIRNTPMDQLVPLAALAVIMAALVGIIGMLALITIIALRAF